MGYILCKACHSIHVILLGGGLDKKNRWKVNGDSFFLPVKVLSRKFRGKYIEELRSLWQGKKLEFHGTALKYRNHYEMKQLLDICYGKEWVPHCKKTFNGAQSVIQYLGKYTHRLAISNYRLVHMDEDSVTFSVKDYTIEGKWKTLTISGIEFIRRFLMHVPPQRFVRIRHYGLLSSRLKGAKLTLCRNLLGCRKYLSVMRDMSVPEMLEHLFGIDICTCSECGGKMLHQQIRPPRHE